MNRLLVSVALHPLAIAAAVWTVFFAVLVTHLPAPAGRLVFTTGDIRAMHADVHVGDREVRGNARLADGDTVKTGLRRARTHPPRRRHAHRDGRRDRARPPRGSARARERSPVRSRGRAVAHGGHRGRHDHDRRRGGRRVRRGPRTASRRPSTARRGELVVSARRASRSASRPGRRRHARQGRRTRHAGDGVRRLDRRPRHRLGRRVDLRERSRRDVGGRGRTGSGQGALGAHGEGRRRSRRRGRAHPRPHDVLQRERSERARRGAPRASSGRDRLARRAPHRGERARRGDRASRRTRDLQRRTPRVGGRRMAPRRDPRGRVGPDRRLPRRLRRVAAHASPTLDLPLSARERRRVSPRGRARRARALERRDVVRVGERGSSRS